VGWLEPSAAAGWLLRKAVFAALCWSVAGWVPSGVLALGYAGVGQWLTTDYAWAQGQIME